MNTIEELQKCIYDTLYEMRLAPRHQIEQAAGLITTRLQPIIDSMKAQEPVAWIRYGSDGNPIDVLIGDEPMEFIHGRNAPLYAAPQVPDGMVPAQTVLEWMEEAKEDMQDWACYASEYFKEKHNLHADLVKMDTRIAELRRIAAAEKRE